MGRSLADALEKSVSKNTPDTNYKQKCKKLKKGELEDFFEDY